jgi:hypothetical protein
MEQLLELRREANKFNDKYHFDLYRSLAIESSQGEPIPGIEDEFKTRRAAYRAIARRIRELEKELKVKADPNVEPDTKGFMNPFK